MTDPWCPSARRVNVGPGCGSMKGGPARAVHHTTEGSSIDGAVATYRKTKNYPTLTVDYAKDDVVQHVAANVGATAVQNAAGGVDTNREGVFCVQIEWIGQAAHPEWSGKPAGPNVRALFDWLRSLGIPDVWPMGAPKAYPASYGLDNGDRDPKVWTAKAGHYGHSQVPENHHGDPGSINPDFVKQTAKKVVAHDAVKPTPVSHPAAESPVIARTKELQHLLGVPQTGSWDEMTDKAARTNLIGWQVDVDKKARYHITLAGNRKPALVKWLQEQGNRQHDLGMAVDGLAGHDTGSYIVHRLKQADAICGPSGFKAALV